MKNKSFLSIYLFVLIIGLMVGCTPTEGEPIAVDRPTTEPITETEQWTTDFLIDNDWRVIEMVVDGEKVTYPTLHVTRIIFWQREDGDDGVEASVPCESTRPDGLSNAQLVNFDESNQQIQFIDSGGGTLSECLSNEVMEGARSLSVLLKQETMDLIRDGNQLTLSSEKGTLILQTNSTPIVYDTPSPTAYP